MYCSLVGRIYQHALRRGVSAPGGSAPMGVSALGGVCFQGGVYLGGLLSQHALRQTPLWTDRHLQKHNLRKLRLRAVMIIFLFTIIE